MSTPTKTHQQLNMINPNRRRSPYNRSRDGCFIKLAMLAFMIVVVMLMVMRQP